MESVVCWLTGWERCSPPAINHPSLLSPLFSPAWASEIAMPLYSHR